LSTRDAPVKHHEKQCQQARVFDQGFSPSHFVFVPHKHRRLQKSVARSFIWTGR
jgi:hypothetical protein